MGRAAPTLSFSGPSRAAWERWRPALDRRDNFLPCLEGFLGPVAGYYFATGSEGLGYYRDSQLEAERDHICSALFEELLLSGSIERVRRRAPEQAAVELNRLIQRAVTIADHAAGPKAGAVAAGGAPVVPAASGAESRQELEAEFMRILELPGGVAYLTRGSGVAAMASGRGVSEDEARRALRAVLERAMPPPPDPLKPSDGSRRGEVKTEAQDERGSGTGRGGGREAPNALPSSSAGNSVCEACSRLRGRRRCAGCRRAGPLLAKVRVVPNSAASPLFESWLSTVEEGSEGGLGNRAAPAALKLLYVLQQAARRRAFQEWARFALVYCRALRALGRGLGAALVRGNFERWRRWARKRIIARAKLAAEVAEEGGRFVPSWETPEVGRPAQGEGAGQATPLEGRPRWRGAIGGTKAVEGLVEARMKGVRGSKKQQLRQGAVGVPGSREWFRELGKEQAFARKAFGYIQ